MRDEYLSRFNVDPFGWPQDDEDALGPYPTVDDIDWDVEP